MAKYDVRIVDEMYKTTAFFTSSSHNSLFSSLRIGRRIAML